MRLFSAVLSSLLLSLVAWGQTSPVAFVDEALYPDTIAPGHSAFNLFVSGANFRQGAVVNWNGSPRTTTVLSQDRLKAQITAQDVAVKGTATITVTNPGAITSNARYFTIHNKSQSVAFTRRDISIGNAYSLAAADFNGDGIPDIAVGIYYGGFSPGAIEVLLNNGNRSFTPVTSTFQCAGYALVVGDFNGDGKLDILTSDIFGDGCVLLGNGDGTFSQGPYVGFADEPNITTADLNGDGKLDLFVAGGSDGAYAPEIYFGNGDGSFTLQQTLAYIDNPQPTVVGDFNRDGRPDVALADVTRNFVDIFLNQGKGKFATPASYSTPTSPLGIAVTDLNGDGKLDIVTDGISILLGNGDGTFTLGSSYINPNGAEYINPAAADFNNDGKQDIAVMQGQNNSVLNIFLGNGDGTLQSPLTWPEGPSSGPAPIAIADFDGQGRLGLATLNAQKTLSIYFQTNP